MKQKYQLIILVVALILITFSFQAFTVFDLGSSERININTDYLSSSENQNTYYFDNYTLIIKHKDKEFSPIGCDSYDNWNYICDLRKESTDEDNCDIYSAGRTMYKCPSGYVHNILKKQTFPAYEYSRNCCYGGGRWTDASPYCDSNYRRYTTGLKYDNNVDGHFFKTELYYLGSLIDKSEGEFNDGFTEETITYFLAKDGYVTTQNNSFYKVYVGSKESNTDGTDKRIGGILSITLQENNFDFSTVTDKEIIYTGENAEIILNVNNKIADLTGNLIIDYTVITGIGNASKQEIINVNVSKGINEYKITIPTENVIEELQIKPTLELYYDASSWSNGKVIYAGTIIGNTQITSIRSGVEQELSTEILSQKEQLEQLRLLQEENAEIINAMNLNLDGQINEIKSLRQSTEENVILVSNLESEVSDQLTIIDGLKTSQSEKELMIAQLLTLIDDESSKVYELLQELNASDDEIYNIINLYEDELIKQSDSTSQLSLSNDEIDSIISDLNNNIISEQEAVKQLKVDNSELSSLVNEYEDRINKLQTVVDSFEGKKETNILPFIIIGAIGVASIYFAIIKIRKKRVSKKRGKKR